MIRIDAVWLCVEPMDMRAGTETALARVVRVFGEALPHTAYVFANRRATRLKVLVHDGLGVWLCARRLHEGSFCWVRPTRLGVPGAAPACGPDAGLNPSPSLRLSPEELHALLMGLPWYRMSQGATIRLA